MRAHTMTRFPGGLVRLQVVGTWLLPLVEMELRAFLLALTFHHGHASRFGGPCPYYIRSAPSLLMFDRVPSYTKHHRFIAHAYPSYSTNKWIAQPYINSSPGPPWRGFSTFHAIVHGDRWPVEMPSVTSTPTAHTSFTTPVLISNVNPFVPFLSVSDKNSSRFTIATSSLTLSATDLPPNAGVSQASISGFFAGCLSRSYAC